MYGQSECLITDILSDANGISFHRFQIASWTLVLSIIFVVDVWQNLAMPTFNTTLMGMLGLSAGTYLGLKIPEPTTPTTAPPAAPVAKTAAVAPATQAQAPKVPGG